MLRTWSIRVIARLMMGALLLVQGIHFVQACVVAIDQPTMAFAASGECQMQGSHGPVSPNACLSQCLQGDQSSPAYQIALLAAANVAVLSLPLPINTSSPLKPCLAESIGNRDPPPLIRFCSLLL